MKKMNKIKFSHKVDYTYHGLIKWYHAMFEKLGWMILAKQHGMKEKIVAYKSSIENLKNGLERTISQVESHDKKRELQIMIQNVEVLMKHANKDF